MVSESRVLEIKDCGNGRFFPMHVITLNEYGGEHKYNIDELIVNSIDTNYQPSQDDFNITLPARMPVVFARPDTYLSFTPKDDLVASPDTLRDLIDLAKQGSFNRASEMLPPLARTSRLTRLTWFGSGLLLLALVYLIVYIYKRRH